MPTGPSPSDPAAPHIHQVTQCTDGGKDGCNGGWTESAYDYVKQAGGITTDSNYPYPDSMYWSGKTGSCQKVTSPKVTVKSYSTISQSESKVRSCVHQFVNSYE